MKVCMIFSTVIAAIALSITISKTTMAMPASPTEYHTSNNAPSGRCGNKKLQEYAKKAATEGRIKFFEDNRDILFCVAGGFRMSLLDFACKNNQLKLVTYMLQTNPLLVCAGSNSGSQALFYAIDGGNLQIIEKVLEKFVWGENMPSYFNTAFHFHKVSDKTMEIWKVLRTHNVMFNVPHNENMLKDVIRQGAYNFFVYMMENGMPVYSNQYVETSLNIAITSNQPAIVEYLLDHGADVNLFSGSEFPPLRTSIMWFHTFEDDETIFKLLLDKGANVHVVYGTDTTISLACKHNSVFMVSLLLEKGADPNIVFSEKQRSSLYLAVKNNNLDLVYVLLKNKYIQADPNLDKSNNHASPYEVADKCGFTEIKQFFDDEKIQFEPSKPDYKCDIWSIRT